MELPFPIRNRSPTIESGNQEIRKGKKSDGLKEPLMKSHEGG
jgi:hypothetical protein